MSLSEPCSTVQASRIDLADEAALPEARAQLVARESPVTIEVADVGAYTLMALPADLRALAVGFLLTEGMIRSRSDIDLLQECLDDPGVLRARLANPPAADSCQRNLVITSSCGLCGSRNIGELIASLPAVAECPAMPRSAIHRAMESMRERQRLHRQTGGTHAAAVFDRAGEILAFAEDVGRHNALDKAVGQCALAGASMSGMGVALSGRVSLEMATKSLRAGLAIIAAVSAPTSLAVQAAEAAGLCLLAFVRGPHAEVFAHPERLFG